jgi:hypothetical protein
MNLMVIVTKPNEAINHILNPKNCASFEAKNEIYTTLRSRDAKIICAEKNLNPKSENCLSRTT